MTQEREIKLPPLPMILAALPGYAHQPIEKYAIDTARAALSQQPSGQAISAVTFVHELAMGAYKPEEIEARAKEIARMAPLAVQPSVLEPSASAEPLVPGQPATVRCNHCGWHGADADLVREVAADEPDDGAADVCPRCKRIGDLQDISQTAASAEPVAWIRKNGFRFTAEIEPQDDSEVPLYAAPVAAQALMKRT